MLLFSWPLGIRTHQLPEGSQCFVKGGVFGMHLLGRETSKDVSPDQEDLLEIRPTTMAGGRDT